MRPGETAWKLSGFGHADLFVNVLTKLNLDQPESAVGILFGDLNRDGNVGMLAVDPKCGKPIPLPVNK